MLELSNMFTIKSKKLISKYLGLILVIWLTYGSAIAQEKLDIVQPLKRTETSRLQHDLFVYASGSIGECLSLVVPNKGQFSMGTHPFSTYTSLGLRDFISIRGILGANISMGYIRERIAQNISFWGDNGVYANWLNADISVSIAFGIYSISAGICSDMFLGSRLVNNDSFSFESLNKKCFNNFSFSSYLSWFSTFRKIGIELRLGLYLKPHIDPNRLAYYTFTSNYVGSVSFGMRLYYNVFTSGNQLKSSYIYTYY